MRPLKGPTEEQIARGYLAESRFFKLVQWYWLKEWPFGHLNFLGVQRASAVLDSRGIDGFVLEGGKYGRIIRHPFNLKTAKEQMDEPLRSYAEKIACVPRLLIHVDMELELMFDRAVGILRGNPADQEERLHYIETNAPKDPTQEAENIEKIIEARRKYIWYPENGIGKLQRFIDGFR